MKTLQIFGEDFIQRVERGIESMQHGRGILLVDDEHRENEGDLIYPTSNMTVEQMALMIRECSGIVCLCLSDDRCKMLELPPMVEHNDSQNQTAFTISIEAKRGVTTGVSAADRLTTIQVACAENAQASDLAHPGHVFPLRAREGGLLERRGHTEGTIDMVKLSGLGDSGVLCELQNEDGSMARLPEIIDFGLKHNIPVLTIEDIVQYRTLKAL